MCFHEEKKFNYHKTQYKNTHHNFWNPTSYFLDDTLTK